MTVDIYEFTIPTWAVCALINGDPIEDEQDEAKLNDFIAKCEVNYGNANFMLPDDDKLHLGFKYSNDIDKIGSDCMLLLLRPSFTQDEIKVNRMLKRSGVKVNECTPNYVAEYAFKKGIKLTSEEIVRISNNYY